MEKSEEEENDSFPSPNLYFPRLDILNTADGGRVFKSQKVQCVYFSFPFLHASIEASLSLSLWFTNNNDAYLYQKNKCHQAYLT